MMMLVTSNGSVYVLKISDVDKLSNSINDIFDFLGDNGTEQQKIDFTTEKLGLNYDKNLSNLEGYFLRVFENFGISLYKANNSDLSDWSNLKL